MKLLKTLIKDKDNKKYYSYSLQLGEVLVPIKLNDFNGKMSDKQIKYLYRVLRDYASIKEN